MAKYRGALPKLPARGYFKKGDKGPEVKKLQKALNWANSGTIVAALKVDGECGVLTERAVSFFEEIHHKTIDGEFGKVCLATLKALDVTGAWRACNWAVSVAKDNRFTYGVGQRAHRSGCYFCQTNTGPRKKLKEKKGEPHVIKDKNGNGHTYERTYCCNTFATAAYAHGAKDKKIYAICHSGHCCGMTPSSWKQSPNFKTVGKAKNVDFSKLKAGDVIINDKAVKGVTHHVWIYLGGDKLVEASNGTWNANSISSKYGAKKRYTAYQKSNTCYVMRYTA